MSKNFPTGKELERQLKQAKKVEDTMKARFPLKERIYIDVIETMDEHTIYFIGSMKFKDQKLTADTCEGSGYFLDSNEVDRWLKDYKDDVEVAFDMRPDDEDA